MKCFCGAEDCRNMWHEVLRRRLVKLEQGLEMVKRQMKEEIDRIDRFQRRNPQITQITLIKNI